MLSKIKSISLIGLEGSLVEVQTDIRNGIQEFEIVCLPDASVRESKKRIESAIINTKVEFPSKKILINLAPANIRKEGSSFDLPIAIGILVSIGSLPNLNYTEIVNTVIIGELSLDGKINRTNGVFAMCEEARSLGIKRVIIPKANSNEVSVLKGIDIIPVTTLNDVIKYLNKEIYIEKVVERKIEFVKKYNMDFTDIKGQENIKRALEVASAGGHNVLMIGSPGSGKTALAKRILTILPDLTLEEAIETTKIHSVSANLTREGLILSRPFRMPHHTVPIKSIIGGGKVPVPGEISLAHNGILFLDELTEYNRSTLEALREPLEEKEITINRLSGNYRYPCNFMFVASMNPCPCGYYGDEEKVCNCTPQEIHRYLRKISGPLLDRIDIQVEVQRPKYKKIASREKVENSAMIQNRVNKARKIQLERYKNYPIHSNAEITTKMITEFCQLDRKSEELLQDAFKKFKLSVRAYEKILKVARTIADLDGKENIEIKHVAEAIQYRSLDKLSLKDEVTKYGTSFN